MINPMDLTGKHVVITGASAGIGRATAVQASKLGARVSLIARNEERLKETLAMLDDEGHRYSVFDLNGSTILAEGDLRSFLMRSARA